MSEENTTSDTTAIEEAHPDSGVNSTDSENSNTAPMGETTHVQVLAADDKKVEYDVDTKPKQPVEGASSPDTPKKEPSIVQMDVEKKPTTPAQQGEQKKLLSGKHPRHHHHTPIMRTCMFKFLTSM